MPRAQVQSLVSHLAKINKGDIIIHVDKTRLKVLETEHHQKCSGCSLLLKVWSFEQPASTLPWEFLEIRNLRPHPDRALEKLHFNPGALEIFIEVIA